MISYMGGPAAAAWGGPEAAVSQKALPQRQFQNQTSHTQHAQKQRPALRCAHLSHAAGTFPISRAAVVKGMLNKMLMPSSLVRT